MYYLSQENKGQWDALMTSQGLQIFQVCIRVVHFLWRKGTCKLVKDYGTSHVSPFLDSFSPVLHVVFDGFKPQCFHCYLEQVKGASPSVQRIMLCQLTFCSKYVVCTTSCYNHLEIWHAFLPMSEPPSAFANTVDLSLPSTACVQCVHMFG